ncbi:MAG: AAA family ATPase, partial [Methanomassiliicoccales archaeon]
MKTSKFIIDLPEFKVDPSLLPDVQIQSLRFQNFKAFEDTTFNFVESNGACKKFVCFHGPNGWGKTTILDVIQMMFARFEGYDLKRLQLLLGKAVRHVDGKPNGIYGNDDFLITAKIASPDGNYEIQINKSGFIKDHPSKVKEFVSRLCYYARFDQELHQFQLIRSQWDVFRELFTAVTGFKIEEKTTLFDQSDDPMQAENLRKYVLSFWVHKPHETIS